MLVVILVYIYHEVEVQENCCERHEVKTARGKHDTPELVNHPHYTYFGWGVFERVLVPEISQF